MYNYYMLQCICVVISILVSVCIIKIFEVQALQRELSRVTAEYQELKVLCDAQETHLFEEKINNAKLGERNWWMKFIAGSIVIMLASVIIICCNIFGIAVKPISNAVVRFK